MLKLSLTTILVSIIVYLVYLEITENSLPNALHDIMENEYSKIGLLLSISLSAMVGKKITLTIPMLIGTIYLLLDNLMRRDTHVENFLTNFFGKNTFDHTPLAGAGGVNDAPQNFQQMTIHNALSS